MIDKKNIIAGLEYCIQGCTANCSVCPYNGNDDEPSGLDDCRLMHDILTLLKRDTIPIEWLKQRRDNYMQSYFAGDEKAVLFAASLSDAIHDWRMEHDWKVEQEAR